KSRIKQFFKKQRREENIIKGKEAVEREIRALDILPKEVLTEENLKRVCEKFSFTNEEDLYAAVGYQGITAALVATRLTDTIRKDREKEESVKKILSEESAEKTKKSAHRTDSGVRVEGVENLLVR